MSYRVLVVEDHEDLGELVTHRRVLPQGRERRGRRVGAEESGGEHEVQALVAAVNRRR